MLFRGSGRSVRWSTVANFGLGNSESVARTPESLSHWAPGRRSLLLFVRVDICPLALLPPRAPGCSMKFAHFSLDPYMNWPGRLELQAGKGGGWSYEDAPGWGDQIEEDGVVLSRRTKGDKCGYDRGDGLVPGLLAG
eukprot:767086-Hanusia_phi.AAC.7